MFIIATQNEFLSWQQASIFQWIGAQIKNFNGSGRFFLEQGLASDVSSWYSERVAEIKGSGSSRTRGAAFANAV